MRQMWHILRKDLRYAGWGLGSIYCAAAVLAFAVGSGWAPSTERAEASGLLDSVLWSIVLLILWVLLTPRVVSEEALTGDWRFWVTRPYDWRQLLAAKTLLLVVAFNVPFVLLQASLLEHAGFSLAHSLRGLLLAQLGWTAGFLLPLFALSSLNFSHKRNTLGTAVFLVLLYLLFGGATGELWPAAPWVKLGGEIVLVVVCGASIFTQYSRHATSRRRTLLSLGLALMLLLLPLLFVFGDKGFLLPYAWALQQPSRTEPYARIAFDPDTPMIPAPGPTIRFPTTVRLQLPLKVTGLPPYYAAMITVLRTEVRAADGRTSTSIRRPERGVPPSVANVGHDDGTTTFPDDDRTTTFPDADRNVVDFPGKIEESIQDWPDGAFRPGYGEAHATLGRAFFDSMANNPASVRLFLMVEVVKQVDAQATIAEGGFDVPGLGRCRAVSGRGQPVDFPLDTMTCLSAWQAPEQIFVSGTSSQASCDLYHAVPAGSRITGTVLNSLTQASSTLVLSPVERTQIYLQSDRRRFLPCPGERLTFSVRQVVQRYGAVVKIDGIRLAGYQP